MIIKLQQEQISTFWTLIKHGVIQSYKIPVEFRQDFAVKYLEHLLSGTYQCWLAYDYVEDTDKKVIAMMCSRIIDEKEYGIRTLALIGIYGFRLISPEIIKECSESIEEFAKANGCNVIVTEYSQKRIGDILESMGFEDHITIRRKILT